MFIEFLKAFWKFLPLVYFGAIIITVLVQEDEDRKERHNGKND